MSIHEILTIIVVASIASALVSIVSFYFIMGGIKEIKRIQDEILYTQDSPFDGPSDLMILANKKIDRLSANVHEHFEREKIYNDAFTKIAEEARDEAKMIAEGVPAKERKRPVRGSDKPSLSELIARFDGLENEWENDPSIRSDYDRLAKFIVESFEEKAFSEVATDE